MTEDQQISSLIQRILKSNPRGLTITELAKRVKKDRSITAKYLDILKAEGKVETRQVGSAKVYWLSQRVPLSAFLCFTRNIILIVDEDLTIVQVNNQFTNLCNLSKEELIGRNLIENGLPIVSIPEALSIIQTTEKEQVTADIHYTNNNEDFFYQMEVIPTQFEEGEKGFTIILEDITDRIKHTRNMEFLTRTAIELVDLAPEADIYSYIAERLLELLPPNPQFYIESYDSESELFNLRIICDDLFRKKIANSFGIDFVGLTLNIKDFCYSAPFYETPSSMKKMRTFRFRPFFDDEQISLHDYLLQKFPVGLCNDFLQSSNIAKIYHTGLVWQDQLYGMVGICMNKEETLENKDIIESFLRQASIALARRVTEEQVTRCHNQVLDMIATLPVPCMLVTGKGVIPLINSRFTDEFGYSCDDAATLDSWLIRAFPISDHRQTVLDTLTPSPKATHGPFRCIVPITCQDGTEKNTEISLYPFNHDMKILFCLIIDTKAPDEG